MNFYKIVVLGCILVLSFGALAQTSSRQWNGKKCAVVLTYDDALNVHLDKVIPALDAFKFKGTFYLVGSSPVVSKRLNEWRAAAKKGHELGNHTLNHPCDGTFAGRDCGHGRNQRGRYDWPWRYDLIHSPLSGIYDRGRSEARRRNLPQAQH